MESLEEILRKYEVAHAAQRDALIAFKKASASEDPNINEYRTRWLEACDAVMALGAQVNKASGDQ